MKRNSILIRGEQGITLVELLVVLAISSLIIGIVTMILLSSLTAFNRLTEERELRNEANYITMVLNNALKNVESVEILEIKSKTNPNEPDQIVHLRVHGNVNGKTKTVEIWAPGNADAGNNLLFKVDNNEREQINNQNYTLSGTYFWVGEGALKGVIQVSKINGTPKPLYIYLSHPIKG